MKVLVCMIPELGISPASKRMLFSLSLSLLLLDVIHAEASPRLVAEPAEIAFIVLCTLSKSMSSVLWHRLRDPVGVPDPPPRLAFRFAVFFTINTRRLGSDAAMMTDAGSTMFQIVSSALESLMFTVSI